jgi:hypothetical protein
MLDESKTKEGVYVDEGTSKLSLLRLVALRYLFPSSFEESNSVLTKLKRHGDYFCLLK